MNKVDLIALLNLTQILGLGPIRIISLVNKFSSPEEVLKASVSELCRVNRIDLKLAGQINNFDEWDFGDKQVRKATKMNVEILTYWDDDYPRLLKKIYDPPVILFVKGNIEVLNEDAISIVGSRRTTHYGTKMTTELASSLGKMGFVIVSGFAKGIDTIAHKSAIETNSKTTAVLGSGLDIIYPSQNKKLFPQILKNGAVISEFPFGTGPDAKNFPKRNRIISGLSHGTVVVEAGDKSGALLTAFNAVDQNREVFAVPGRITDSNSIGCNRLIRHGAIPVLNAEQIANTVNPILLKPLKPVQKSLNLELSGEEMNIYSVLSDHPKHIDTIVEETDLTTPSVLTTLLSLELKGVVSQLGGKQFVRN
tara:strand:+ start:19061 stop:20155 length:1095 start_codon:yes stop_codon:yes gene_type:complete